MEWHPHYPDDDVPPEAAPRPAQLTLPLPYWTMAGTRMTVSEVAQFLGLSPKRITQLAEEFTRTLGRSGLPCIRMDYGRRERLFFSEDVEAFKEWRLRKDEARIAYLTRDWQSRAPVAARRT
jgi:hypothetical protein